MNNKLIVLEGIDGVGKTELSKHLSVELGRRGIPCVLYERSPLKASLLTSAQKQWAHKEAPVEAAFMLFFASTIQKSGILTRLLEGSWVIVDRYIDSVFAHHLARGLDPSYRSLYRCSALRLPDHTFHVTVGERERLRRVEARPGSEQGDFESAADETTLLGRKRIWFSRLVANEIRNHGTIEEAANRILTEVAR